MKKIVIAIGLYFSLSTATMAQVSVETTNSKENFTPKKLKIEEVNFVTSYYQQDGNKSAVTGGIGTEYLFNIGNSLDINLSLTDKKQRVHGLNIDFNIDAYTSASSDNIGIDTRTGASRSDVHIYPSVNYSLNNPKTGITQKYGVSYSTEWDYQSYGFNAGFTKQSENKNTEFTLKGAVFLDTWEVILPTELRTGNNRGQNNTKPRNTYSASMILSQIINKNLQVLLMIDPSIQEGLLSTPYHRAYFTNGNHTVEKLPGQRYKLPIGLRASYFAGDRIVVKGFYRYYADNWGMTGHTANLEVPVKLTSFFSLSPFYRFNRQTAVDYFKPYGQHLSTDAYYTSDYDISGFDSHFVGMGLRTSTPGGVLGISHFNAAELRVGYYHRTTGMNAGIVSLHLKIK